MKRTPAAAAIVGMACTVVLTACGEDPQAAGSDGERAYGAIIKGLDNPFFQAMEQGIDERAASDDVEVEVQAASSITDTSGQADKLNAMAQNDYACYVVNPISGTNLVQGLAQLAADDTPVVNIDSPVEQGAAEKAGVDIATYIGTDNVEAGKLAGKEMVDAVGSGSVALIGGISGDPTSGARLDGFKQAVGGKLSVSQTVAADWDRQQALTKATDILGTNRGIKGFFVANDDMALGVARAVANEGLRGKITIISVDGIEDGLNAVKSGAIHATVAQYPYAMGRLGVQACRQAADGEDLPETITSPVAVVTEDKADAALEAFPKPFEKFDNPLD